MILIWHVNIAFTFYNVFPSCFSFYLLVCADRKVLLLPEMRLAALVVHSASKTE